MIDSIGLFLRKAGIKYRMTQFEDRWITYRIENSDIMIRTYIDNQQIEVWHVIDGHELVDSVLTPSGAVSYAETYIRAEKACIVAKDCNRISNLKSMLKSRKLKFECDEVPYVGGVAITIRILPRNGNPIEIRTRGEFCEFFIAAYIRESELSLNTVYSTEDCMATVDKLIAEQMR